VVGAAEPEISRPPANREEAEQGYRRLRAVMIFSAVWASLVIAPLIVFFGSGRAYTYVMAGLIVALEVVSTPLWIRSFRRRRDEQIRRSEGELEKNQGPSPAGVNPDLEGRWGP
jgi:hypothetical protein